MKARLIILRENNPAQAILLDDNKHLMIGTGQESDLQLSGTGISRSHCIVVNTGWNPCSSVAFARSLPP